MTDSVAIKRQHAWGRLYNAANAVAARIGADGAISTRSPEISILMDALAEIDGGQWCPGIMPYPTALPEHAEPPPEPVEPVAWLRFQEHADRPTTVHLCDSDHPRAFQVYAAQPAEPQEPVASYWLIECKNGFTGWYAGHRLDCRFFDTDPRKAYKFASKELAENEISERGHSCMIATEHVDIAALAAQPAEPAYTHADVAEAKERR